MKTSIATVSLSGDLEAKVCAIATAGFDGFELFENDLTFSTMRPSALRTLIADVGLELFCLQPFRDFEGMLDGRRSAAFDRAERKFDLMAELGTDLLLIPSTVSSHAVDGVDRIASDLRELGTRAAARGMRIAYEALAWGRHTRDWMQAWDAVRRADHDAVGLVLDTYHLFARGNPIAPIRDVPADRIFIVQLADAPSIDMEVLRHSRHLRNFPGQGDYPVVDFMTELASTGYDGVISHEIFNDDFRVAPTQQTAIDGYRSMLWLEESLHSRLRSKPIPPASMPTWTAHAGAPPTPAVGRVSFVEFGASSPAEAAELSAYFARLGMPRTHTHRTKNVVLHARGDAYLVVNAEPRSYASEFAERRGAAACAIGIETEDADAAMARATAYLASEVVGRHDPGQIQLPAVKSVGGVLLYFVDTALPHFVTTDFDAVAAQAPEPIGFHIDHVAQAVASHELLSVLLFYRAVLGFGLQPPQELVDPNGLVTSRTVVSASGSVRLPLNTASSGDTSPERFRSTSHGSGVQHVAIATSSIASLVASIDPTVVLAIPANYYDDLSARFALDGDTLDFLRTNNVLYDRSDEGELFHLYTAEIHGVFFEFLQRRDYTGFGAANAPARLAAQSRTRVNQ